MVVGALPSMLALEVDGMLLRISAYVMGTISISLAVQMLDGIVTDGVESRALSYRRDHVDIYIVSWGPVDDGKTFDEPGHVTQLALKDGALKVHEFKSSTQISVGIKF